MRNDDEILSEANRITDVDFHSNASTLPLKLDDREAFHLGVKLILEVLLNIRAEASQANQTLSGIYADFPTEGFKNRRP